MAATDRTARHLELLTDTIAAVNSSLDLDVVFERIAAKVTSALEADACFVYLYDETDDVLELRATHDGRFGDPSHRPRMHLGEGITGTSAAEGRPVMIAEAAHLDTRFVGFPNLPEDEYDSILAVPVHARDRLEGALNVRTRLPRAFGEDEVALLTAIAGQVGQAIENAKLYEQTRARVSELESLAVQEIHHRVKNNLQTVASLLRLQARAIDDPAAERALEESVHRILSIAAVHDLLTTSQGDDVDCAGLIGRLEAMLGQGLGGREVDSRLQPVVLPGQRATAVALVFCELFQNALEHGRGRISVELVRDGGSIVMSVGDEGQGPPPGPRQGLGLTIAAALVREELRGRIDLRESGGAISGRVLIAEDETIIRLDVRAMLERAGFEVVAEARDGREAVALAAEHRPDLAVMDVKMPELDGIDAASQMLEQRQIPIVMLTAFSEAALVGRAVDAGVFGYLVKPFRESDLLPAIEAARARHAELLALRDEAGSLRDALEARKLIERAKGLLMEKDGLSEGEAFARLRGASQQTGRPLREVAAAVCAAFGG
jgi:response regulator NasT